MLAHGKLFGSHCWHNFWRDRPWPITVTGNHGKYIPTDELEVPLPKPQAWVETMRRCCECGIEQPAPTGYE